MHLEPGGESLSHREPLGKGYWSWKSLSKWCFGVLRSEDLGLKIRHSLTLDATSVLEWEEYSRLPLEVVSSVSFLRPPVIDMPICQAYLSFWLVQQDTASFLSEKKGEIIHLNNRVWGACVHASSGCACEGRRAVLGNWFSPSVMWDGSQVIRPPHSHLADPASFLFFAFP